MKTLDDLMSAQAQLAVGLAAKVFRVTLDYSESSIQEVEKVLSKLHEAIPKGPDDSRVKYALSTPEVLQEVSTSMGAYIGEVIKREWGGKWKEGSRIYPDQKLLTLETVGMDIWPHMKVAKRSKNGPEDDVWFYFLGFKEHIQKKYDALRLAGRSPHPRVY